MSVVLRARRNENEVKANKYMTSKDNVRNEIIKYLKTGNPLITGTYTYVLSYQDFEYRIYDHTNCENCSGTITLVR